MLAFQLLPLPCPPGGVCTDQELRTAFKTEFDASDELALELATALRPHYPAEDALSIRDLRHGDNETILDAIGNLGEHAYLPPSVSELLKKITGQQLASLLPPGQRLAQHKVRRGRGGEEKARARDVSHLLPLRLERGMQR